MFAVVDASASNTGVTGDVRTTAAISASDRQAPPVFADRNTSDADNPFEHGRLPVAGAGVTVPQAISSKPALGSVVGLISAELSLPERPPRT
ncbi:hypothetical protein HCU64_06835 [Methylobacterium sp. C25]|uniref:hypothetical protein n=1 Tax=Methylobacterium sp. C25 TaxID=2721622 RepID=UPI001F2D539B|nr:hypothetical protein [Methylobacterium sp. C25]MCE4223461.1 hypothetical protein [Methylobacterium sp. C25]